MPPHLPKSTGRLALLLAGLSMFGPFSIDAIFPAFPVMGEALGADKLAMQQTISAYLVAYALMSLVHGPMSDALGRRRVILAGLVVFIAASVGCALANDLATMLAFRALQGLSAGVGLIVGRAVIRDLFDGDDAQRLMSQVSMIFGIAPAIAPVIGGWILGWGHWHDIFWFLVGFGVLLLAATWMWLPETHPAESRSAPVPRRMLRDYVLIFANRRFQRLAAAGALNFSALFLYIASAPAFVLDLLRLDERSFAWFFGPMIGGMMLGAFTSGRVAGRMPHAVQVNIGFACCGLAAVANVAYGLLVDVPAVPWAVLPAALCAFGVALVFPVLTLAILDMYPRQRGSASSLQAFTSLALNAVVAGLLSPMVSGSMLTLALAGAAFTLAGWLVWRLERYRTRRLPEGQCAPGMPDPAEHV
ncbi:multidrug effflux MFS transporter [Luteimonas sp. MJ246]|uniref:multidrug effflux MFS transporter n=1 Tax=Luteimonas sp. MJ174 TaxID=3129237 RepID=UPI0031BAC512